MSAWSTVVAYSGFDYHGAAKAISLKPRTQAPDFTSFFSTGLGWGSFSIKRAAGASRLELAVTEGSLPLQSIHLAQAGAGKSSVTLNGQAIAHHRDGAALILDQEISVPAGGKLTIQS